MIPTDETTAMSSSQNIDVTPVVTPKKSHKAWRKMEWDGDDHVKDMLPWEFALNFLTSRERTFLRALLDTGDYEEAMATAGYKRISRGDLLQKPYIEVAIRRCAWLAKDPVKGAKALLPYVMKKHGDLGIVGNSVASMKEITAMSGLRPAEKRNVRMLTADLTKALSAGDLAERPWVDKTLPWIFPQHTPTLPPSVAAERTVEERSKAATEALHSVAAEFREE